ncbi:hypothetical protein NDU88_006449 [Pleurodeles waltl]|uniref:Uncharacterized protein n=1 Tax=Pleurodeles waltl TaxID=8319 RepID=A0AAV7PL22_PLEWA|nr:hypothetical protein NDU88_006449 [Pleurodeles waltl]
MHLQLGEHDGRVAPRSGAYGFRPVCAQLDTPSLRTNEHERCEALLISLPRGSSPRRVAGHSVEVNHRIEMPRIGASSIKPWAEAARVLHQGRRGFALCHFRGSTSQQFSAL